MGVVMSQDRLRDSRALADGLNELNAKRAARAEAAAGFCVAIAVGVVLALLSIKWALGCDVGHLCAAVISAPTGVGHWLLQLCKAIYLRSRIAAAEKDIKAWEAQEKWLPEQIKLHRSCIAAWRAELIDCERVTRAPGT